MATPKLIIHPFAQNAIRNDISQVPNESAESNLATYPDGFPQITATPVEAGGKAPEYADMNGIFYEITDHLAFLNRGGVYEFSEAFAEKINGYPKKALLVSDDGESLYLSLEDNNKENFNTVKQIKKWKKIGSSALEGNFAGQDGQVLTYRSAKDNVPSGARFENPRYIPEITERTGDRYVVGYDALTETVRWMPQSGGGIGGSSVGLEYLMIGTPIVIPSSRMPNSMLPANRTLALFEDYPQFAYKYQNGDFAGMILPYNASDVARANYRGMFIPNDKNPTGLYLPDLNGMYLHLSTNKAEIGLSKEAGLPNIYGTFGGIGAASWSGATYWGWYTWKDKGSSSNIGGQAYIDASRSNPIYGKSDTIQPPSVSYHVGIYLGQPA